MKPSVLPPKILLNQLSEIFNDSDEVSMFQSLKQFFKDHGDYTDDFLIM